MSGRQGGVIRIACTVQLVLYTYNGVLSCISGTPSSSSRSGKDDVTLEQRTRLSQKVGSYVGVILSGIDTAAVRV